MKVWMNYGYIIWNIAANTHAKTFYLRDYILEDVKFDNPTNPWVLHPGCHWMVLE